MQPVIHLLAINGTIVGKLNVIYYVYATLIKPGPNFTGAWVYCIYDIHAWCMGGKWPGKRYFLSW